MKLEVFELFEEVTFMKYFNTLCFCILYKKILTQFGKCWNKWIFS